MTTAATGEFSFEVQQVATVADERLPTISTSNEDLSIGREDLSTGN